MNKVIYLGTTFKCSACKLQELLIKQAIEGRDDIELKVCDYPELPRFIQENVSLSDFPITIFVEDEVIKDHIIGTLSPKGIRQIINDIEF